MARAGSLPILCSRFSTAPRVSDCPLRGLEPQTLSASCGTERLRAVIRCGFPWTGLGDALPCQAEACLAHCQCPESSESVVAAVVHTWVGIQRAVYTAETARRQHSEEYS